TGGQSRKGCNIDDAASLVPAKLGRQRLRQQKRPAQIGLEKAIPDIRGQGVELWKWNPDIPSGIVDEDVDPTKSPGHLVDASRNRFLVALVEVYGGAFASQLLQRPNGRLGATGVTDIGNNDIGA